MEKQDGKFVMIVESSKGDDGGLLDLQLLRQVAQKMGIKCYDIRFSATKPINWEKFNIPEVAALLIIEGTEDLNNFTEAAREAVEKRITFPLVKAIRSYGGFMKSCGLIDAKNWIDHYLSKL